MKTYIYLLTDEQRVNRIPSTKFAGGINMCQLFFDEESIYMKFQNYLNIF